MQRKREKKGYAHQGDSDKLALTERREGGRRKKVPCSSGAGHEEEEEERWRNTRGHVRGRSRAVVLIRQGDGSGAMMSQRHL